MKGTKAMTEEAGLTEWALEREALCAQVRRCQETSYALERAFESLPESELRTLDLHELEEVYNRLSSASDVLRSVLRQKQYPWSIGLKDVRAPERRK